MSILSALKQQSGSIDDLAKLPQAMIMQMAQKGQIRQDMIAPILARKAELTQAIANTRAMQNQAVKPTIMEQVMNQNAMAEAPESSRDMGVAQIPMREDMFAPQRMAGGGIVAFADNQDQPVSADMPTRELTEEEKRYLAENEYMKRSRGLATFGTDVKNAFTNPSNYNPASLYDRFVGQPFANAANRFANADLSKTFRTGQQARTGEIPMFVGNELTPKGVMVAEGKMNPNENVIDVMQRDRAKAQQDKELADFDKATALFQQEQGQKQAKNKSNAPGAPSLKAPAKQAVAQAAPTAEDPYTKFEKMLMDEREAAKGAREDAKWSRMLEAGLGILGGDSPYAMVNIGKGATPGLKGYAEDVKGLRSEERGRVKDLMGIESGRLAAKTAQQQNDYHNKMLEIQRIQATKPTSTQEIIALGRSAGLDDRSIMGLLSGNKDPEKSGRDIAMKAFFDSPILQAQYKNDVNAFLRAQGIGATATGQPVLNYVPGQGLK